MSNLTIPQDGDDNADHTVQHLTGGGIRVSFGTNTRTHDPAFDNTLRGGVSDGSAFRMKSDGTVEQFGGITRSSTAGLINNDDAAADLMDTVRSPWGSPVAREVRPTDRVRVGGTEIEVRTAVSMGYLRQTGPNQYVSTGKHLADAAGATPSPKA